MANKGGFSLRKTIAIVGAICCIGGLAACANYAEDRNPRYRDAARPIGYYSTDHDQYMYGRYGTNRENDGNAYMMDNQNGPLADLLNVDMTGRYTKRTNPTLPLPANFGVADKNYHGHLNPMTAKTHPSYYDHYDGRLAETVAHQAMKVRNVTDARALVYKGHVLVAVATNASDTTRVEQQVAKTVAPYTKGKHVRVVSNPSVFQRARVIDNNIRYGRPFSEIERELKTIFYKGEIIEHPANTR